MSNSFLSLDALSVTLGLPRTYLRAEAKAERIPCLRIGRRLLFDADAVRKTLAARAAAGIAGESINRAPTEVEDARN